MKKTFLILLFVAGVAILSFTSCSHEENVDVSKGNSVESVEFGKLCNTVEQIGKEFSPPSTRGVNWKKWGGRVFSATVDGLSGYVAGPAGLIVGPLCSWAFEEHWEHCTRGMSIKAHSNVLSDDIPMDIGYVFLKENSTRADSIGYYHNVILEEIARSGKSYVSDEGEIDYQTLLSDCVVFAKKYGVEVDVQNTESYKDLSKSIVESFTSCGENEITKEEALKRINTLYKEKFNLEPNLERTECFQNIIVEALVDIDDDFVIKDFANQLNKSIMDANVSPKLKRDLMMISDVTINSKLYWKNE